MPRATVNRHWTKDEDEIMRQFYSVEGHLKIAERLPMRTAAAIKGRACQMGLRFFDNAWSESDEEVLRQFYPIHGQAFVARRLNRTRAAVKDKAQNMGIAVLKSYRNRVREECGSYKGYQDISQTRWNSMRSNAGVRNLEFNITIQYAWELYERQERKCALSGVPIQFASNRSAKNGTASLDRIDSSEGYVEGNVQWLHINANRMKWDLNQEDFISFCHLVADLHPKS